MVRLRDNNPTTITPFVTYTLIGADVFIYLYLLSLNQQQLQQLFYNAAMVPCQLSSACPNLAAPGLPEWMTLFTSQFLHGSFLHIAANMLYLWIFGNNIEDRLGHVKYLIFYLVCGALAALAQWFFSKNSAIPYIGSSGAIAGIIGAYILRYPRAEILRLVLIFFFLLSTVRLSTAPSNIGMEDGGIIQWAHGGGFVFGAILGSLLGLFRRD